MSSQIQALGHIVKPRSYCPDNIYSKIGRTCPLYQYHTDGVRHATPSNSLPILSCPLQNAYMLAIRASLDAHSHDASRKPYLSLA